MSGSVLGSVSGLMLVQLGGCLDGVCVVGVDGIGSYQASGVFQAC
ncbi:Uncharacterised protein [Corynebacterium diphtheriae]|nr:Uncharacterised protein [Corynebacterium diphtheriae]